MTSLHGPSTDSDLYCGAPALSVRSLLSRDPAGGIDELFHGRRAFMSYNTRVAIHAGVQMLGLRPGDEVLAPAYNCGSEIDPLTALDLKVNLYSVGPDLAADPDRIEPLISNKTRAIYVTHYFGELQPHMGALRQLCDRYNLRLIEDCALSLLSGRSPVEGRHGDIAVFCFHKFIPSPQGGVLVVNATDLHLYDPFRVKVPLAVLFKSVARTAAISILRPARFDRTMRKRRLARATGPKKQAGQGSLSDIPSHYYFDPKLAGCGLDRLTARAVRSVSVEDVIAARRRNWLVLASCIDGVQGATPVLPQIADTTCPQNFPVYVQDRDEVARRLQAHGIAATPWWAGYNRNLDWSGQREAIALKESILGLPVHQLLTPDHQRHIARTLQEVLWIVSSEHGS
ncbi:DegT/DnrJ/EryC1/StrS family aminotransferase (plasmid) [Aliiroseovarius sp. M344]|uniref:DegT/DnrJ/EryC1/StrS family aminotransferase n=1 Tax=Aliiroseovarius sp. M344 TaxID=2867010 RepID=UPI0021AD5D2F|nr:DegT/DnrJ/EryC1/StrS family aminotransferase [Aliiroseovarius sp. M344]UWQ16062.1 DegT/DnrJ/EryC1/StrS family aminotransferase [Aliiroseovarius sp. M344]